VGARDNDFSLADPRANQVLQKMRAELAVVTAFRYLGRPVSIPFAVANTQTEVQHGLAEIPDGYIVLNADAAIKRVPGKQWTKTLAYLQSDMVNSSAVIVFGVFREGVQSVSAT
jgi:hypothetical protein